MTAKDIDKRLNKLRRELKLVKQKYTIGQLDFGEIGWCPAAMILEDAQDKLDEAVRARIKVGKWHEEFIDWLDCANEPYI